jgi:hypothetical protein
MMGKNANSRKENKRLARATRRWTRLKPASVTFLKKVAFSQGTEVRVIDISRGGMMLETEVRLCPQMKVQLKLVTSERVFMIGGCVVHSSISSLSGVPRFHAGIAFDDLFPLLDDVPDSYQEATHPESKAGADNRQQDNDENSFLPIVGEFDESTSVLTFIETDISGEGLLDRLGINEW